MTLLYTPFGDTSKDRLESGVRDGVLEEHVRWVLEGGYEMVLLLPILLTWIRRRF